MPYFSEQYLTLTKDHSIANETTMFRSKINKLALALLFFAFAGFLTISVGGEFFHSHIHHHADQSSHDRCFVHLLQTQAFLAVLGIAVALVKKEAPSEPQAHRTSFSHSFLNLPNLRAPPVSL